MIWAATKALLWRHLTFARKQGCCLGAALGFILAVIVIVPIALGPDPILLQRLASGMMWLALLLAVLLTAERIFQSDFEDGSLDLMTMTPVPFELSPRTKPLAHLLTLVLTRSVIGLPLDQLLSSVFRIVPTFCHSIRT